MSSPSNPVEVSSYLVRAHDALAYRADFRPIFEDFELHTLAHSIELDPFARQLVHDGLVAVGLHMVTRRLDEHLAWTISIQEPPLNLFFTADVGAGALVGRAFLDHVQKHEGNLFYAETKVGEREPRRSTVEVEGVDILAMVEWYYRKSEQLPGRFFVRDDAMVLVQALPETDIEWIEGLDRDAAFALFELDGTGRLHVRQVAWHCGCDKEKILRVLASLYQADTEELFQGDPAVDAQCPRCGGEFAISREEYEEVQRGS